MKDPNESVADTAREDAFHRRYLTLASAVVLVSLWLRPMVSSLWLDELGTWWVIKDGLGTTIDRALEYHGQSPLYYVAVWATSALGGSAEWVLRLPSLAATALAGFFLHRLVKRLLGDEVARLSVFAFIASGSVAFSASDARPYAFALLLLLAATLVLVAWLEEGGLWRAGTYGLCAAAMVWAHYLFALVLLAHALYAYARISSGDSPVRARGVWFAGGTFVVAAVPLGAQLLSLWDRRLSLSIPGDGTVGDLILILVSPVGAAALFFGVLLARAQGVVGLHVVRARRGTLALLVPWLFVPPTSLFAISAFTPVTLLSPRYYLSAAPAAAVFVAWAVGSIRPSLARRLIVLCLAILAVATSGSPLKGAEDWRGAAGYVAADASEETLVLLHTAFVEASQLSWMQEEEHRSYLLSPVAYYPIPGRIVPMPYLMDDEARSYLEGLVTTEIALRTEFFLVTRYPFVPFRAWLDGRLAPEGWHSEVVGKFGVIEVISFKRPSDDGV